MYLFTRRTRLVGGNGSAGIEWATKLCGSVKEVTGHDVQLWASVYSPGFGTVSWTAWVDDLAQLEAIGDKLGADAGYTALVDSGSAYTDGSLDDALLLPLYGAPDPTEDIQYVTGVEAVVAGGNVERAMTTGIALAQNAEKITGRPTMFVQSSTGPYGAVGWLTGYPNIASLQASQEALGADADWLKLVDTTDGCFVEDPTSTQQLIWRRLL